MSGITSSTGLVSNIDYGTLIEQLLSIEARPRTLAQQRVLQLQSNQAAYLDLQSKVSALRTAASGMRTNNIFNASSVASSNAELLSGTASAGATPGSFSFLVDRVVSTQQVLSRSFADRNTSAVGATSVTLESARARLDSDTPLSALNGGQGVERGKIVVTDHGGRTATIDLSRAATVGEALEKLNNTDAVRIRARVEDDKIVIEDNSGVTGTLTVANATGSTTATSLGIEGSSTNSPLEGQSVYVIGDATSLASLNDGNGIRFNSAAGTGSTADFTIKTRDGGTYSIDIGEMYEEVDGRFTKTKSPVADIAGLRTRIEEQTEGKVTLEVTQNGRALQLVDSSSPTGANSLEVIDLKGAAADLRLVGVAGGDTLEGAAVLAGLNSTLSSNLVGDSKLINGDFTITTRDGSTHSFSVSIDSSVSQMLREIGDLTGGAVTARISDDGVGITLIDNTAGTDNFVVEGDAAEALGVATDASGVERSTIVGKRRQHQYIAESTLLSTLNNGAGAGTGEFEIKGPRGTSVRVNIGSDSRNLSDVISEINSKGIGVTARINDKGDGILIEKSVGETGVNKISVRDVNGTVGKSLGIVGEAANGTDKNFVDGSFEKTIALSASDTLDQMVTKINNAGGGVAASVIRDASGANPFRLKLTAKQTGLAGAFTVTAEGVDLGLSTISEARNARVFFGSDDPARAVLIESTTNTIDGVVDGLTVNAKAASEDPVTLTVTRDSSAIKTAIETFVSTFNTLADRLDKVTAFDQASNTKGVLLGDSTANELRRALYDQVSRPATGVSSQYKYLSQVGVKVGAGGVLEIDSAKLDAALANDPEAVANLFVARTQETAPTRTEISPGIFVNNTTQAGFTSLGVAEKFAQLMEKYSNSADGVLTKRSDTVSTEIANQNSRIASINARLERRREQLTRQFASLETTIANLQRQQSALGSIG